MSKLVFGNLPSAEEIERRAAERHENGKASVNEPGRFIATSLGAWLKRAQDSGISSVNAVRIADVPRKALMEIEEQSPEHEVIWNNLVKAKNSIEDGHMVRWDACSHSELKWVMGESGKTKDQRIEAGRDTYPCMRVYELHYEYPADIIPVWSRPWIDALEVDGFPVEFRVFVRDSKVIGVASYYPQRALPSTPEIYGFASRCKEMATQLVKHLDESCERPWLDAFAAKFNPELVNATMDFLVSSSGDVLFLEAGPPFGAGAHPCAFIDCEISGVALELAPGVILR